MIVRVAPIFIISAQLVLVGVVGFLHSPNRFEAAHLASGIHHHLHGRFDAYGVNPHLVRYVAAVPAVVAGTTIPQPPYGKERPEFRLGDDLIAETQGRFMPLLVAARWSCLPFAALGAWVCFRWSSELYGIRAGYLALMLWSFSPNIIGHAAFITPDAHAAAMGVAGMYMFWKWLQKPTWHAAVAAGAVLGLAELSKSTLLILLPLVPLLWIINERKQSSLEFNVRQTSSVRGLMLVVILLTIGLTLNAGYGFEGFGIPLQDYQFKSKLLTGDTGDLQNRFVGTVIAGFPVPLPANYLLGLDQQRFDFERGLTSYCGGVWSDHGWWYFYLYAAAFKVPLGTFVLAICAVVAALSRRGRSCTLNDQLVVLLPFVCVVGLVSSQTGFSIHFRYVLPAFPFAFIAISSVTQYAGPGCRVMRGIVGVALCWTMVSSLAIFPHSGSYFNELTGGPLNGHRRLVASNIAWGQDLLFLKQWLDDNSQVTDLRLASIGPFDPRHVGISYRLPPLGPVEPLKGRRIDSEALGPLPGWYAIDVNVLRGSAEQVSAAAGARILHAQGLDLSYLSEFEPVGCAGYSFRIFHITHDEANKVRNGFGLPPLPDEFALP